MKLKTLANIGFKSPNDDYISFEEYIKDLRQEAIKWIKEIIKGDITWSEIVPQKRIDLYASNIEVEMGVKWGIEEGVIHWVMHFFCINEDDLK